LRDLAALAWAAGSVAAASCAALGLVCAAAGASPIRLATIDAPARAPGVQRVLYAIEGGSERYVSVFTAGNGHPTLLRTISTGLEFPNDLCVDKGGTLYVADERYGIVEYRRGASQPFKSIALSGINLPMNIEVGVDGSIAVVFLANSYPAHYGVRQYSAAGNVEREIDYSDSTGVTGVASDTARNLYVAHGDDVLVYAPGQRKPFATLPQADYTGAIAIDRAGDLLVGQPYLSLVVTESLPSGNVVGSVVTPGGGVYLTLDAVANELYTVSMGQSLEYFNYRTGKPLGTMSGFASGIAVDPSTELR
jgi:hypothetical protein